jgi:hydrogenase expression/formation protein HypE
MTEPSFSLACPAPIPDGDRILLAHGEGMRLTRRLIRRELLPAFDNEFLRPLADGATLPGLAVTTDTYVVSPLFFPGGDIGSLAVHGTVNDLTAIGADPLYLAVGLVLEEGLPLDVLRRVVASLAAAARRCKVTVVTGDTKVVPRGKVDQLFVSVTGIGRPRPGLELGTDRVRPGDRILVSGTIGDHGIAVLAARQELGFDPLPASDSAPLHGLIAPLWQAVRDIRFLRDPTRGGVSAVLHELVEASGLACVIDEDAVPLSGPVRGACELLGLDPLYVANEGKMLLFVGPEDAAAVMNNLHRHPLGANAAVIGTVTDDKPPRVLVRTRLGVLRILDEPSGAPLPRIC